MGEHTALLPCPFCGGSNITSVETLDWVCCEGCGASFEDAEPSSVKCWNTRALTATAPGWDEATRYLQKIAALVDDENACDPLDDAISYANKALEALRREAPASSGVAEETWSATKHNEIIKRLMEQVGMPNSTSLYTAFKQFANELHSLATSRPDAGGGVRVNQLEWIEREGVEGTFDASTSIGHYIATITDDDRGMWFVVGQTTSNYMIANIGAVQRAAQADYERRVLSALSTPPAAMETNGSLEARLREALKKIEYASRKDSLTDCERIQCIRAVVDAALSAGGDEAKKSEGGSRKQPFDPADAAGVKSGTVTFDGQTGRPNRDEVGASQTPGSSMSFAADKPITAEQAFRPSETNAEARLRGGLHTFIPAKEGYGQFCAKCGYGRNEMLQHFRPDAEGGERLCTVCDAVIGAKSTRCHVCGIEQPSSPTADRREIVARAICCPSGCVREDDCWAWSSEARKTRERQVGAILAALDGGSK